jgi:predicted DNA-binding protein (MmcQ/YjbR family)
MFDDKDPLLKRVRKLALALPDANEKISHGRPAFYTVKVFAYYGGSQKIDGEWHSHDHAIMVPTDPGEREALLQRDDAFLPAYLGPSGWVGIDLGKHTDWDEIAELLDAGYRRTAGKRRVAALDAQASGRRSPSS